MLFVKIEDAVKSVELLVFPRLYKETANLWIDGQAVILDGKVSEKDTEIKVLVNRAVTLDPLSPQKSIDNFKRMMMETASDKPDYRAKYAQAAAQKKKEADTIKQEEKIKKPLKVIFLGEPSSENILGMKELFSVYPGEDEVYFKITENGKSKIIKTAFRVDNNAELNKELNKQFGDLIKIAA